ncbi:MAG TPA: DUF4349 domain-containing protein [Gemmataceae bacterium]|nr:DUF4349 domain-containing protein [Gemmataceae bacterium]
MSDHTWVLENLATYLADGLEPAERERFEQHTAECEACAAALTSARDMDATLTGLFAGTRPSTMLEDRAIQSLRTKSQDNGWRLPIPAWLAVAAAALLLLGFTGAMASQLIVQGGLSFPQAANNAPPTGSMSETLLGYQKESSKDVSQLAQSSREKALERLNALDATGDVKNLNGYSNDLGYYPPAQALDMKSSSTIHSRSSNLTVSPPVRMPPSISSSPDGNKPAATTNLPPHFWMGFSRGDTPTSPAPTDPSATHMGDPLHGGFIIPKSRTEDAHAPKEPTKNGGINFNPSINTFTDSETVKKKTGKKDAGPGDNNGKDNNAAKLPDKPEVQPASRKIVIRTGAIEYEVASFDAAVATITRLVKPIKGGFVATVNSDKGTNGKVRGSVVVRVPPEQLDALILDLRTNLGKNGELKNQRIASLDIGKQYTDLESRLRAGRAMEERLLQIIKTGKGEIKDLLAVEKELGEWRERIEKIEGELRYYANQVALSTLTITLYEKEIQAAFGVIETERVQMGLEVDDVDESLRAAQKAVREAKGRIMRSELKQHPEGQVSAILSFEVSPDAAGPMRDRLRQLGTVSRLDIDRLEQTEGGTGKPTDGKTKRSDARFIVSFYNLANVAPRETVTVTLACINVEAAQKTLLERVEKASGRVVSSHLNSAGGANASPLQNQGEMQFQVKTTLADAVLEDVKSAGEVTHLQVSENPKDTTSKKRGFVVRLMAQEAATARETAVLQIACADVAASYRAVQQAIIKAKGRIRNAQLNEQDRQNITGTLDFEVRRSEEAVLHTALTTAGDIYTRNVTRAPDAENVIDSKVHWQLTLINQARIPPRETFVFGVEVADVDQTAAMLSALVGERQGRTIEANISRERNGQVTGKLVYDVPMAKVHELIDQLRGTGNVRVQQVSKHPEVPDSVLATARLDVTLSNGKLLVPSDEGFGANLRRGLSTSFTALSWSLSVVIVGLCVVLPWVLVIWAIYRLVVRWRRRAMPTTPAA